MNKWVFWSSFTVTHLCPHCIYVSHLKEFNYDIIMSVVLHGCRDYQLAHVVIQNGSHGKVVLHVYDSGFASVTVKRTRFTHIHSI